MEKGIAKVKIDDISFQQLMLDVKKRLIRIPDFQREFVWEMSQIVSLLDSIYHHYPIGSFLLWKTKEEIESYRTIGDIQLDTLEDGNVYYVLDGQQRITSLFASLEKADIKVKVSGKTLRKKLEIYFDLDEEVFLADPFSNLKQREINKPKRFISIPTDDSYFEFLKKFGDKLEELKFSKEDVVSWLSTNYYSEHYANMFFNCCINWNFLSRKHEHYHLGENAEIIYDKTPKRMLKILGNHFEWFDDLYLQLVNNPETTDTELGESINERSEEEIKDLWYIRQRLIWLQGLGLGEYNDGHFRLFENGKVELQNLLSELQEEKSLKEIEESEFRKRFISVKQLATSTLLKLAKGLSEERYDALDKVFSRFNDYPFSIIYVLDQPIEIACEIFERINNSGKILNLVDLMVAKSYTPSFNLRKKLNDFLSEMSKEGYSDIPEVTIIQCLAAILGKSIKRRDILALNKENISNAWDAVTESIRQAVDFLKSSLNLTNSKIIPYNTLLIPIAYYFYKNKESFISAAAEEKIKNWFWKAAFTNRYDSAVETKINDDLIEFDKILSKGVPKFDYPSPLINEERIINQKLNLGSAFCKSILSLLNQNKPLEFLNTTPVQLKAFSKLNSAELHHIFPQAYLKKNDPGFFELKDSIVNIALAGSALNKKYKDQAPSAYLKKCAERNNDFKQSLRSHFIYDYANSGLPEDDYEKFLSYRALTIYNEIKAKIGQLTKIENAFQKDEKSAIDLFEGQMRMKIHKTLSAESPHYWKMLDKGIRSSVEPRIKQWLAANPTKKYEDILPLDFCQIFDYFNIIIAKWKSFKPLFGSQKELEKHIININNFRNGLMHSRPIDISTKKIAEGSLLWFEKIFNSNVFDNRGGEMAQIDLPYGGTSFDSNNLKAFIKDSGRNFIIQGQKACNMDDHPKPSSLDYWLRGLVDNPDTKQAVNEVIDQLVATGDFEEGRFVCPDSGETCKGIRLIK